MRHFTRRLLVASVAACSLLLFAALVQAQGPPNLEAHYTFDDEANPERDSSGNDRHGEIDDLGGESWIDDPERGGVFEFMGANNGFMRAEIGELPGDNFTVAMWAYRDPELAGDTGPGANDGLFVIQDGGDTPSTSGTGKVIGGWVQKTDSAVWGRIVEDGAANSLNNGTFFMEDEVWTHFAYRGDGTTFEIVVDGESGIGPDLAYFGTLDFHDTLFVGKQGSETWGGRLDDFRVYSRALSDEEIAQIMSGDEGGVFLHAGDADMDCDFDQLDLVQVQVAAKYLTGEPATWGQGDWDGAPGGSAADKIPPPGDGQFNQLDIIAALNGDMYLKGSYCAEGGFAAIAIPEPSTFFLLAFGLAGVLLVRRRDG